MAADLHSDPALMVTGGIALIVRLPMGRRALQGRPRALAVR
jgi:hypothetical protein